MSAIAVLFWRAWLSVRLVFSVMLGRNTALHANILRGLPTGYRLAADNIISGTGTVLVSCCSVTPSRNGIVAGPGSKFFNCVAYGCHGNGFSIEDKEMSFTLRVYFDIHPGYE